MGKNLKKILLYTRPLVPPWDEGSKNLAFEIARHNDGNFVFELLTDKSGLLGKETWPKKNREIQKSEIFFSGRLNIFAKLVLLKRLFRFNLKADLIHFLFTPRRLTSWLFHWRLENSKVKTLQTIATLDEKISQNPQTANQILFADLIIAQSNYTLEKLKKLGLEARMIYPAIDLEKFQPQPKDEGLLQELKISHQDFVLLFAGEYARLEAIDDILSAFEILEQKKELDNLKLVLACRLKTKKDKLLKEKTRRIVAGKGWGKHFVFLDFAEDVVALYNLADLNIFPVRKMAGKFDVPLVLIESMACQKTVLVSDLPVLKELIQDNENGLVVPRSEPKTLAEKIIFLKNNPEINTALALAGKKTVQDKFDIQKIARQYQEVYEELLDK